jgi:cobalt-zinc-cadmium resistance protein CzcA
MFERIIRFAIEQRWLVMVAVLALAALGVYNYQRLLLMLYLTLPMFRCRSIRKPAATRRWRPSSESLTIETVMAGLPNLEQTRSLSRYGLSQVTVVFKDGTDIYFARQLVNERIQQARDNLPAGVTPRWDLSLQAWVRSIFGPLRPRMVQRRQMERLTLWICARYRTG